MSHESQKMLAASSFKYKYSCEFCKDTGAVQDLDNVFRFCACDAAARLLETNPSWCDEANAERKALVDTLVKGLSA